MIFENYEGLPISKYLTVGAIAVVTLGNGMNLASKLITDVDVVCKKEDIKVEVVELAFNRGIFLHEGRNITCYYSDEVPTLQKFLDNHEVPTLDLIYLIEYGNILFPSHRWVQEYNEFLKIRNFMKKFTADQKEMIRTYGKELEILHNKIVKTKRVRENKYISKEKLLDVMDGSYKEVGFLDTKEQRRIWYKYETGDRVASLEQVLYLKSLYYHICPAIFENGKHGPRSAFKWAFMRMCTKDLPLVIREFFITYSRGIRDNYNKNYVTQFIKKYKDYGSKLKGFKDEEVQRSPVSATQSTHIYSEGYPWD